MEPLRKRVLVIGYGNPGRLDDGLGPALAARLEALALPDVTVDADYQLTVEDAHAVANHDAVVFADAAVEGREPFGFERVEPTDGSTFSSHGLEPGDVVGLAARVFDARVPAFVLAIRGYEFDEFGERLSPKAERNLEQAAAFIEKVIREGSFGDPGVLTQKAENRMRGKETGPDEG